MQKKPNILFVFSDEHRRCSLPFTEAPEIHAPHMTRLAEQGSQFTNCCSTSPVCTPYRGMLLTGQWPHQNGYVSNHWTKEGVERLGSDCPTIARMFRDGGYYTGYVGKWHLMNSTCKNAGFDVFIHWLYGDDHWKTEVRDANADEAFHIETGYNATGMTDQALNFMESAKTREEPFLLMLSLNPPHFRWDDAPEDCLAHYPDGEMVFRDNVEESAKQGDWRRNFRHYQAHITAVDRELGRIMDYLDQAGLAEDTVLIYTSDHGSSFGSNGHYNKCNPFEESANVPFIIRRPGHIPAGAEFDHNIGTMDLIPTLCGLAGIPPGDDCGGLDFSPALLGGTAPDPETQLILFNSFPRNYFASKKLGHLSDQVCPHRSVRGKRYTYSVNGEGEWLLFDRKTDPLQQHNLMNDPAAAEIKAAMAEELARWLRVAEDPFIPADWPRSPVCERVAFQQEHYTLLRYTPDGEEIPGAFE